MMNEKKTAPIVEAIGAALDDAERMRMRVNYSTNLIGRQDALLLAALPIGEHEAIHASALAARLGLRSHRSLRARISAARRHGLVVCSSNSGYFLPATATEAAACNARLTKAARTVLITTRPLRRVPLDGQEVITEQEVVPAIESEA